MPTRAMPLQHARRMRSLVPLLLLVPAWALAQDTAPTAKPVPLPPQNAMANPYGEMIPDWPHTGDIELGSAIGILADGQGGLWLQHRGTPSLLHFDAQGDIVEQRDPGFSTAHGMCRDSDGNFWMIDSGPFWQKSPDAGVRGNQVFKYSPDGTLLLTLGKAGVSRAGSDTFIQPTACIETPDGNILIADGHWPRPSGAPRDGDRLVLYSRDGEFLRSYGQYGRNPGEFMGPHGLAYDSQGRLFVADRSNNRIQIFDKDMNVVDEWHQFGRPSNLVILADDTLIVADSESNLTVEGPADSPEGGVMAVRNPGWKFGIRIGSARDGSLDYFIPGTRPEGLAADADGRHIYGGLTGGCDTSPSGGCLQEYVKP